MAGEPALDKILTALKASIVATATTVDIDRPEDEEYGNAELDAINILHNRTSYEPHSHGETLHRASVDLDMIVSVEASAANGARLRIFEADVVAALFVDRTLGGVAQVVILISSGGDEDVRADHGARALSIEILYLTPLGDHRTIIGAAGLIP